MITFLSSKKWHCNSHEDLIAGQSSSRKAIKSELMYVAFFFNYRNPVSQKFCEDVLKTKVGWGERNLPSYPFVHQNYLWWLFVTPSTSPCLSLASLRDRHGEKAFFE